MPAARKSENTFEPKTALPYIEFPFNLYFAIITLRPLWLNHFFLNLLYKYKEPFHTGRRQAEQIDTDIIQRFFITKSKKFRKHEIS